MAPPDSLPYRPLGARLRWAAAGLLAAWGLVYPTFYLFYSLTHDEWWYLRFLLPAAPPLLVAAVLATRRLAARCHLAPAAWWLAPAALATAELDGGTPR